MSLHAAHIGGTAQRGASMIELMITMLLGLFLMAGVLQLFTSNKTTYSNMEGISQIQENARAGLERIKDRVRMAGYMGCSNLGILEPNNLTSPKVDFSADTLIKGYHDTGSITNDIVDGTDRLNVISTTLVDTFLNADMAPASNEVPLTNTGNFQVGDPVMITDCENADILQVTAVDSDSISYSGALSKPYLASSTRIMSLQNVTYSVETAGRTDDSGAAVLSLFETPAGGGARVEIMTGVEDMRIAYGVDTTNDGQADDYINESAVTSWAKVVSVRLRLLVSSGRGIGRALRPYVNLDGDVITDDQRMRRTFTTTISLRNRSS